MMKKSLIVLSAVACFALAGCGEKGPAEEAGEKIDNAAEQTKDAVEDAGHQGPAERAGEAIDEKTEQMQEKADQ